MKVIFTTDLPCLLSLVFVSLSLVFVHVLFSCFDLLFYLYLKLCLAREFTYCHIRNVTGGRVCGVRADLRYLVLISCGCPSASLFTDNSKPVTVLAIRNTIETLPVS